MKTIKLDDILDIVNDEKENRKMENYAPCYPMLRVVDNKLYIAVMVSDLNSDIWTFGSNSKAEYWCLLDTKNFKIVEFNNTLEKDFSLGIEEKNTKNNDMQELENIKEKEYIDFLLNDIKSTDLPLLSDLFKELDDKLVINNKEVNVNEYISDNLVDVVKIKAKELVDLLIQSKYSLITICYENLFNLIINEYNENGIINIDRLKLCVKVMENYYYGLIGIKEFFNI